MSAKRYMYIGARTLRNSYSIEGLGYFVCGATTAYLSTFVGFQIVMKNTDFPDHIGYQEKRDILKKYTLSMCPFIGLGLLGGAFFCRRSYFSFRKVLEYQKKMDKILLE